jgi:hypothetical protein
MTKLLIGVLSLALLGAGGVVAAVDGFDSEPVRAVTLPDATTGDRTTTGTTTTETVEDDAVLGVTTSGRDELEDEDEDEDGDDRRRGRERGHGGGDDDRSGSNSGRH